MNLQKMARCTVHGRREEASPPSSKRNLMGACFAAAFSPTSLAHLLEQAPPACLDVIRSSADRFYNGDWPCPTTVPRLLSHFFRMRPTLLRLRWSFAAI